MQKMFLVFQIIAFELVVVNCRITTRILVVGSQRVKNDYFTSLLKNCWTEFKFFFGIYG